MSLFSRLLQFVSELFLLGALAKLLRHVRLSFCIEQLGFHGADFHEI
jgi:hypothetical protein